MKNGDGDGAIRIPDEVLQELELDVGDSLFLIEEFIGNTRCLVLSKTPQIADRMDDLTEAWMADSLAVPMTNEAAIAHVVESIESPTKQVADTQAHTQHEIEPGKSPKER